jgi:hypothetical protein
MDGRAAHQGGEDMTNKPLNHDPPAMPGSDGGLGDAQASLSGPGRDGGGADNTAAIGNGDKPLTAAQKFAQEQDAKIAAINERQAAGEPQSAPIKNGNDTSSDIDTRTVLVTFLKGLNPQTFDLQAMTLPALRDLVLKTKARTKVDLPLLTLTGFSGQTDPGSDSGCIRWDGGVNIINGIVLDYDLEIIGFDEAHATLKAMNVRALLYTSPSYTAAKPRLRVVMPVSTQLPPEMYKKLLARVNGRFGNIFSTETFKLSQSYYYGRNESNAAADHKAVIVDGRFIDQCGELEKFEARGYPDSAPQAAGKKADDKTKPRGYDEHIALLGDGPGCKGFNEVLTKAAASYVSTHGTNFDRDTFKDKLLAAVEAATMKPERPLRERKKYKSNKYLYKVIDSAIKKYAESASSHDIARLNEIHAVLPIGGKTRVVTFGELEEFPGRETIVMVQTLGDLASLQNKYRHEYQDDDGTHSIPVGSYWLNNPHRKQYDGGMAFMPLHDKKVVGTRLNLWNGYGVRPVKPNGKSGAAGCKLFLDFMRDVICGGNAEHFAYLEKREAAILQKRIRSEIAVGLRTEEEGIGKGFYETKLGYLYGNHAMVVTNPKHVIGAFNPHLETLLRLTADEALFVGNHEHRNSLFGLVTDPNLTIEPKGCGVYNAHNFLNISIISNSKHFVPVSGTARRFFIPTLSTDHMQDFAYFKAIDDQLCNEGGFEALLYHFLHEVDLDGFNVRDVTKTAGLAEQAALGRRGIDGLVEEVCSTGRVPCEHYSWAGYTITSGREDTPPTGFFVFIDRHRDRELGQMGGFKVIKRLVKEWDCKAAGAQRDPHNTNQRISGLQWPTLAELRAKFVQKFGPQGWMHDERTEWSTSSDYGPGSDFGQ